MTVSSALYIAGFLSLFAAEHPACNGAPVEVSVAPLWNGHSVTHLKPRSVLAAEFGGAPLPGYSMQAYTQVSYRTSSRLTISSHPTQTGWCAALSSLDVGFGLAQAAAIHMARELTYGSCEWNTVLDHELDHVSVAHEAVHAGSRQIEQSLKRVLATGLVVEAPDRSSAEAALRSGLSAALDRVVQVVVEDAQRKNAQLDTPASYEKLAARCR